MVLPERSDLPFFESCMIHACSVDQSERLQIHRQMGEILLLQKSRSVGVL